MKRVITASLLLVCFSPLFLPGGFWNKYWFGQWGVLMSVCSVAYAYWIGKELHWTFAPITLSTLLSALWVYGYQFNQYNSFSVTDQASIKASATYSAISFIMLSSAAVILKRHANALKFTLGVICLLATIHTLSQIGSIPWKRAGFVGNASMNGCLIACTLPFLLNAVSRLASLTFVTIALGAVFLTGASVPIGVLALVMAVLLTARKYLLPLFIAIPSLFSVAYAVQGNELFSSTGRFEQWKIIMDWWSWSASPWFGTGAGTSVALMPYAQKLAGVPSAYFMWAHNDWLQILFEQGAVGLGTTLLAVVGVLWNLRHDRTALASAVGYAGMAVFNYPLHLPVHAAVGAMLVCLSVRNQHRVSSIVHNNKSP